MKNKVFLIIFVSIFLFSCQNQKAQRIFNIAVQDWNNRQYEEALQNFIALARTYPQHDLADDSLYWVANIYQFYLNRPTQAVVYYRNLIRQFPDSVFYIQSNLHVARIYEKGDANRIENAIYIYQDLVNHDDISSEDLLSAYWSLVFNKIRINRYQDARSLLKTMNSKYTGDEKIIADIYNTLALTYEQEGKLQFAKIAYKEALKKIEQEEFREKIYFQYANLLEELGELKPAIDIYEILQENNDVKKEEYSFKIDLLKKRLKKIRR